MVLFDISFVPVAKMIVLEFKDDKLSVQFGGLGRSLFWPLCGGLTFTGGVGCFKLAQMNIAKKAEDQEKLKLSLYGVGASMVCAGIYTAWVGSICNRWVFDKTTANATHQKAAFFRPWSQATPTYYDLNALSVCFMKRTEVKFSKAETKQGKDLRITAEATARICLLDSRTGDSKPMHMDSRAPELLRVAMPWPTRNLISNAFFLSDFLGFDWRKVSSQELTADEHAVAVDLFHTVDYNKSGVLDGRELRRFAQSMPPKFRKILGADASRLAAAESKSNDLLDAVLMQRIVTETAVQQVGKLSDHMQVLDSNGDGRISTDEFLRWIKLRKMSRNEDEPSVVEMCGAWKHAYLASIPSYANIPIISHLFW